MQHLPQTCITMKPNIKNVRLDRWHQSMRRHMPHAVFTIFTLHLQIEVATIRFHCSRSGAIRRTDGADHMRNRTSGAAAICSSIIALWRTRQPRFSHCIPAQCRSTIIRLLLLSQFKLNYVACAMHWIDASSHSRVCERSARPIRRWSLSLYGGVLVCVSLLELPLLGQESWPMLCEQSS